MCVYVCVNIDFVNGCVIKSVVNEDSTHINNKAICVRTALTSCFTVEPLEIQLNE